MPADADARVFETHGGYLRSVAYRMLGSMSEAEDVLQEAYLRYSQTSEEIREPRAYLSRVVVRLCLDLLKSARARRETYVGPWLPEPILDAADLTTPAAAERGADVSIALLLALERLSPLERAAFLLHDVFDVDYAEVARWLERPEATCRKLAQRAREHVRDARPRHAPSAEEARQVTLAFQAAALSGDATQLASLLTDDAILYSDGGGKVRAATKPIVGATDVAKFVLGIAKKFPQDQGVSIREASINGSPGALFVGPDGVIQTFTLDVRDNKVSAIYIVRNPDKLGAVRAELGDPA